MSTTNTLELHVYTQAPRCYGNGLKGHRMSTRVYRVTEYGGDPWTKDPAHLSLSHQNRRECYSTLPHCEPRYLERKHAADVLREWRKLPRYRWGRDCAARAREQMTETTAA